MADSRSFRLVPIFLIAFACGALLFRQFDLTNSDLGRHLKNGEIIVQGSRDEAFRVLHTNFYSYTAADYPFFNHHWLAGVVFFLVWRVFSFDGLTMCYAILVALALGISYWAAQRIANPMTAAALTALIVPIVAWRDQIRPEAFTYFLFAISYWVLLGWFENWFGNWSLLALPGLMLLWINLHIGFVFGFLLLGAFALRLWARREHAESWKWFIAAGAACVVAALANPSGIHGLLYPFHIFGNYGYDIAENLSLRGIADRHQWAWPYDLYLWLLGLMAVVCVWRWLAQKPGEKPFWAQALVLMIVGLSGIVMVRNQPLFGLLMAPMVAELIADRMGRNWGMTGSSRWIALGICAVGVLCIATEIQERNATAGFGRRADDNNAADFLRANNIIGPVFNDFDIGGYLIYNLAGPGRGPQVFVDGRPEAYPPGFFQDVYLPALSDRSVWERLDRQYRFNAIVISMQDGLPAIEKFILTRVRDADWAPVYTDPYSLIFVRRNEKNVAVIRTHLIPREAFR
jgi:hypothetical protein